MSRTKLAVGLALLVVVLGGASAFALGVGPVPGGGNSEDIDDFPTQTPTDDASAGDGDGGGGGGDGSDGGDGTSETTATSTSPFVFTIDQIENCGTTCRDVTATIHNQQDRPAEDVTVYTRIYAGNSTAEDDVVWQGKQDVGTIDAGRSVTQTKRVSLSYSEAYAVRQEDGWITVVTTVQSADQTLTFQERRDVA